MAEKSNKAFSNKQEKMIASELGGYQIGLSGAGPTDPGDVKTYEWLVECKTHTQPGHNILFDADVWTKIKNEAMGVHRKPVLIVDDGSQSKSKTWCLCRSNNINLTGVITADIPMNIRKNITCKEEKLSEAYKKATKGNVIPGTFFEQGVFETEWCGENVLIMPLATFKELFEK